MFFSYEGYAMLTIDPRSCVLLDLPEANADDIKSGKKETIEMGGYVAVFPLEGTWVDMSREIFHVTELEAPPHEEPGFSIEAWMAKTAKRFEEDVAKNIEGAGKVICMYARILTGRFKDKAAAHPLGFKDPMFPEIVEHVSGSIGGSAMAAAYGQKVN